VETIDRIARPLLNGMIADTAARLKEQNAALAKDVSQYIAPMALWLRTAMENVPPDHEMASPI
jgi:alpha-beta hydrolase superfamily lysophospholipase